MTITRTHKKGDADSVAVYSDCERYRYTLTRVWDPAGQTALFVMLNPSTATEVQKLEKKSLVSFIHIGQPTPIMQAKFGTAPRIQLNDSYRTEKDILDFIAAERDKLNESDRALMTVCLKADDQTKMGIITDVKQELRRANALKLSYAASKSMGY